MKNFSFFTFLTTPRLFLILLASGFFFAVTPSFGQSNENLSMHREKLLLYEPYLNNKKQTIHTSIKPFSNTKELEALGDSIKQSMRGRSDTLFAIPKTHRKKIFIHGILESQLGYEQTNKQQSNFLLEGGLSLDIRVKNKFSFNAVFLSGNSSFPSYIDAFISKSHVIPGFGSAYSSAKNYSYHYYSGYFSYSPNKIFNFQIGKDKHFWGDGYRSLFISDISNSFPFLKISTTIWKLKYVNLFTQFQDITDSPYKKDFKNKYGTFHCLSWNTTKWLNVSLFESIIWQGSDENRIRNFDIHYFNPVIFLRPVEYSLGSSDNAFLGFAYKIKIARNQQFYGQIILDEFLLKEVLAMNGWWANKQGMQFGFKNFNLFTLKNLTFQTELNMVRPYTYSHGSVQQNYGHYNQALAHPMGANFAESVSFLNYRYKKWIVEAQVLYTVYGKDENGSNWGQNIFDSYTLHPKEYGNEFFQGLKTNLRYTKLKTGYYLIPSANLIAEIGIALRQEKNSLSYLHSTFFFVGIKTGIMNRYSDF